ECNNPTKRLVVGMSPDVRVCVGSGYMTQKRNMRSRHSHQEQQYRAQGSEQNAVENAESQYPAQSNRSSIEIQTADSPHAQQCWKIQQSVDGRHDDRSKNGLGEILEQPGQEQEAQRKRNRGKYECQRGTCASSVIYCRLREAAGDRIAVPHRGREVGC